MTNTQTALDTIVSTLASLWLYDIEVMSQPWMYQWLLVPAFFYIVFMVLKWWVLTMPVWLPIRMILLAFRRPVPAKKTPEQNQDDE